MGGERCWSTEDALFDNTSEFARVARVTYLTLYEAVHPPTALQANDRATATPTPRSAIPTTEISLPRSSD